MHPVLASTAEAELGALFLNAKTNTLAPCTLPWKSLDTHNQLHPFRQTAPLSLALQMTTSSKKSKAIAIHFYWIHGHV